MIRELRQARKMHEQTIKENQTAIIVYRAAMVDDGFSGLIPDPTGEPVPHDIKCRIFHERAQVPTDQANPAGLSTNLNRAIMTDRNNEIQKGDYFTVTGIGSFTIGPVDPLYKFQGLVGYQAPLTEAI